MRVFVYAKDLASISGLTVAHCRRVLCKMKKKYNVKYVTTDIYLKETGVDLKDKIK